DEGIDVLGFLDQDSFTEALLAAKLLVAPSLGGESFGMVLTRAFACATPVVASDISGYRDVMTSETSVAVPPSDEHALVEAVCAVRWESVVVAIALNLASVVARSIAWHVVIRAALPPPRPSYPLVFSAFSVGLFANAVLPGRIGELARVAVLTRKSPGQPG